MTGHLAAHRTKTGSALTFRYGTKEPLDRDNASESATGKRSCVYPVYGSSPFQSNGELAFRHIVKRQWISCNDDDYVAAQSRIDNNVPDIDTLKVLYAGNAVQVLGLAGMICTSST